MRQYLNRTGEEWGDLYETHKLASVKDLLGIYYNHVLISEILKRRPHNTLELGSARGIFSIFLSFLKIKPTGIDNVPEMIALSKRNNHKFNGSSEFKEADITKLPFKDDSFDLIFSQGTLEHLNEREFHNAMLEQQRIARDSIIINVPVKDLFHYNDQSIFFFGTKSEWRTRIKKYMIYNHRIRILEEKTPLYRQYPLRTALYMVMNWKTEISICIDLFK